MKGVSVVICCYNSSSRLPETIRYLSRQIVSDTIKWEVIIVNNASTDNTVEVAKREWDLYRPITPLIIIDQPIPGLSYAREKGIEVSNYEYILFCDDDNWLSWDYIEKGGRLLLENKEIVILGGKGIAECEGDKPKWFDLIKEGTYAIGAENRKTGYTHSVYGAGMFLRKDLFYYLKERNIKNLLSDRKEGKLSSGGDTEFCKIAELLGRRIWYQDDMEFTHFIPSSRLNWDYVKRLHCNFGEAECVLKIYYYIGLNLDGQRGKGLFYQGELLDSIKRIIKTFRVNLLLKREGNKDFLVFLHNIYYFTKLIKLNKKFNRMVKVGVKKFK